MYIRAAILLDLTFIMGKQLCVPSMMPFRASDLDHNQEILIDMSNLGKIVIVRARHGAVIDLVASYHNQPRVHLQGLLRTVLKNILPFDDDANWKQQAIPCSAQRASACEAWRDFCNDCLIVQCLRLVLYGKQLVITTMDYSNTATLPGTGLPVIKIRAKLKATLKKAAVNRKNVMLDNTC